MTFSAMLLITLLIFHEFLRTSSHAVGANGTFVRWVCDSVSSAMGSLVRLNSVSKVLVVSLILVLVHAHEKIDTRIFAISFLAEDATERDQDLMRW